MATKDTAPKTLSMTARMQYERFINGTNGDRNAGFTQQVINTALGIDFSLDEMNNRLEPTNESRKQAIKDNRSIYATDEEWDTLNKFLETTSPGYNTRAEEVLISYVTTNNLDGMDAQMQARKSRSRVRERSDEAKIICESVLADTRNAFTVDDAEAALTRLREYHISLRAEADTLKELIASS